MGLFRTEPRVYGFAESTLGLAQAIDGGIENLLKKHSTEFQRDIVSRAVATLGVGVISALGFMYNTLAFGIKLPIATVMGLQNAFNESTLPKSLQTETLMDHLSGAGYGAIALLSLPVTVAFASDRDLKGIVESAARDVFAQLKDVKYSPWNQPVPWSLRVVDVALKGLAVGVVALGVASFSGEFKDLFSGYCGGRKYDLHAIVEPTIAEGDTCLFDPNSPVPIDVAEEVCLTEQEYRDQCPLLTDPYWKDLTSKCAAQPSSSIWEQLASPRREVVRAWEWGVDVLGMNDEKYTYTYDEAKGRVDDFMSELDPAKIPQTPWCQQAAYDLCQCISQVGQIVLDPRV